MTLKRFWLSPQRISSPCEFLARFEHSVLVPLEAGIFMPNCSKRQTLNRSGRPCEGLTGGLRPFG